MDNRKIIGLVGFKNSGKNTVADWFVQKLGYKEIAFADPLKDISSSLFLFDRNYLEGRTNRDIREEPSKEWSKLLKKDFSMRQSLIDIAKAMKYQFGNDIFVNNLKMRLEDINPKVPVIITDVRYSIEIEMLKSYGAKLYFVVKNESLPEIFLKVGYSIYDLIDMSKVYKKEYWNDLVDIAIGNIDESEFEFLYHLKKIDDYIYNLDTIESLYCNLESKFKDS